MNDDLPVAVIGGGPVGLAAAAHLLARNIPVRLYEAGATVGANVRDWGHVRLFSPWSFNVDKAATAILKRHGWQEPRGDGMPTGGDLYDAYLRPLADTPELAAIIQTNTCVKGISRKGTGKVVTKARDSRPFLILVQNGAMRVDLARAVIDASGTWQNPNPLGASGLSAIGEAEASRFIAYGIPDVFGAERANYVGRRVLVVGGGHSAANALLDLARLAESDRRTELTWAVRGTDLTRVFGGGDADQLAARGKLGCDLKSLSASDRLKVVTGFSAERVKLAGEAITVSSEDLTLGPFDRIIVATGQRPNLDMTRELRLDLDPWLESPKALGPAIDPNLHSCGSVPPHGYKELAHPEPGYFAVGVKSYGRAPTFLMATGYEQVRSVAAYLAGDLKAANEVQLVLPETGVCSVKVKAKSECCGGPAPADVNACCPDDATAKATGAEGCGCSSGEGTEPAKPKGALAVAERTYNVLFLCTGNSARSIMAEAILNKEGGGKFRAWSAGSLPKGQVNPNTLTLLRALGFDVSDFRSKSWQESAEPDAPNFDFIFTVCDNAAGESCPVWPGNPMTAHWGIPDPAEANGTQAEIGQAFADAYRMLKQRIGMFTLLPVSSLDRLTLQARLREIGRSEGATAKADAQ